ncbi:hypothetical protein ACVW0Y_003694 [Pseudomonas sp. TE3786]
MLRISQRLPYLSLLVLLASAPALQAQPTTPATGRLVYRIDANPPEDVFAEGITSSTSGGTPSNYTILDHALGLLCWPNQRSPWISTTLSGARVNEFLASQIPPPNSPAIQAWVYTIQADDSYLEVLTVLQQVIRAGRNSLYGYGPQHAQVLQNILERTTIRDQTEVLTLHIAPTRIISAAPVQIQPNQRPVWGTARPNPNFQTFTPDGTSHLPTLAQTVPPDSPVFAPTTLAVAANFTCFQTCDGATVSHRIKRSTEQPANLNQCRAEPNHAQALIGSEDD